MLPLLRAALLAVALVWPGAVLGQSPQQTAASWGLMGTWTFDCSAPPAEDNITYKYVRRNNQLFLDRDYGGTMQDSNTITSLRVVASDQIEYLVSFGSTQPPSTRYHRWLKHPDGRRIRVFTNRNVATGEVVIDNGKFTASGAESGWFTRCR